MELSEKQIKRLQKLAKFDEDKDLATIENLMELDEKIEDVKEHLDIKFTSLQEELKKKLESELVLEIDREELKGENGRDGKDGKNYILTNLDKKDIARSISVPVVEKVIEKVEVIHETPIVTEIIKEVAVKDNAEEIINKINEDETSLIKKEKIEGLEEDIKELKERQPITQIIQQGGSGLERVNTKQGVNSIDFGANMTVTHTANGVRVDADNQTPDLSGYVPYTGATTNVNLGANNLTTTGTVSGTELSFKDIPIRSNTTGSFQGTSIFVGPLAGNTFTYQGIGIGFGALQGVSSTTNNVIAIGSQAGRITSGTKTLTNGLFFGIGAGLNSNGTFNTFIGNNSGLNATGSNCIFFGATAGSNSTGNNSSAFGPNAFSGATHNSSLAIGNSAFAGSNNPGGGNTAIGFLAGVESVSMQSSTVIGSNAGRSSYSVSESLMVGTYAGYLATGSAHTFLGTNAGVYSSGNRNLYFGFLAGNSSKSSDVIAFGTNAGAFTIRASLSTFIGGNAGNGAYYASNSVIIGDTSGSNSTNAAESVFIGRFAGYYSPFAANSIFIGPYAGYTDSVFQPQVGVINAVEVTSGGTNINIDDVGTLVGGDNNATVKVTAIDLGSVNTETLVDGGTGYTAGDQLYLSAGNYDCSITVDSVDGPYHPIATTSLIYGGNNHYIGEYINLNGSLGGQDAYVEVTAIDGDVGGVNTVTADGNGTGYIIGDQLSLQGGNYDCVVEVTSIGGSGEITGVNVISAGTSYSDASSYSTSYVSGSTGDGNATITVDTIFVGAITAYNLIDGGIGYVEGDTATDNNGFDINILTVGSTLGAITTYTITSAGTGYSLGTILAENNYTYYSYAYGAQFNITSLINGTATAVVKVAGGTNYYQGEYQVTGIGYDDLYVRVITFYGNPTVTGTSICIGQYSGTGTYSNSIAIGRGIINSATQQANIGNVLFLEGIYNSDSQSSAPIAGTVRTISDVKIQSDSTKYFAGAGDDMSIDYDGTQGNIKTGLVAASDLHLDCGTNKTLVLDQPVWDDVNYPIIIRTTGAGIPTMTTFNGNLTKPNWAVNDFNMCDSNEFPHSWKEGSACYWHIHLDTGGTDTTNRYVKFELEYAYSVAGVWTFPAAVTTADLLIPANTPAKTQIIFPITNFTPTNALIGDHCIVRLKRVASTGTAPTANPWIPMVQMHIQKDTIGSRQMITK